MTGLERQVVDRGDTAPPYRARKVPEAVRVHLCGFDEGILVLRCHDVDLATALAAELATPLDVFAGVLDHPSPIWVRWVVNDPAKWPNGPGAWERELRGTVGATPAVLFARTEVPT